MQSSFQLQLLWTSIYFKLEKTILYTNTDFVFSVLIHVDSIILVIVFNILQRTLKLISNNLFKKRLR